MKAVSSVKYLYQKRSGYYLRIRVPKRVGVREFKLSLTTKNLAVAIVRIKTLQPLIKQLKRLVLSSKSLDTGVISETLTGIKEDMKKQLSLADIEPLITKLEQSYSDSGHVINALSTNHFLDVDDKTLQALQYLFEAETVEERDTRLMDIAYTLNSAGKSKLAGAFASTLKATTAIEDEPHDDCEDDGIIYQAKTLLESNGYEVNEQGLPFRVLLSKLHTSNQLNSEMFKSIVDADAIAERKIKQLIPQPAQVVTVESPSVEVETGPLFSEVYAEFLDHKVNKENLSEKMQKYYEQYITVWNLISEDKPIEQYTPKDIGKFVDRCFEFPRNNIKPYNKMTWQERVEADVPEEDIAQAKTAHQYYKWLQGVFAYAKRDTVGYINNTPCTIKRDFKSKKRGVYSTKELHEFIKAAEKPFKEWHRWVLLLAIYTGARRGEIAQLRKQDIKLDDATGRYYILITDQGTEQKLKTENARRMIPVHQRLLDAGLMAYVARKEDQLFDELYSREAITNWFTRHVIALDVPNENELGHKRSFHSFRHTFITTLMNKGVSVNLLQQVVGHEISSFGITGNYTHKSTELKPLLEVVDQFEIEKQK